MLFYRISDEGQKPKFWFFTYFTGWYTSQFRMFRPESFQIMQIASNKVPRDISYPSFWHKQRLQPTDSSNNLTNPSISNLISPQIQHCQESHTVGNDITSQGCYFVIPNLQLPDICKGWYDG